MRPKRIFVPAVLFAGLAFSAIANGADYPWGNTKPDQAPNVRVESPHLTRQLPDTGHWMSLYEAWMVEKFCRSSSNQEEVVPEFRTRYS